MSDPRARLTYADAGVDVSAYDGMLARVRTLVESTHAAGARGGIGAFSGLYDLPGNRARLAATADGVGTKTKVAVAAGSHRGIGHDLVNHCANDVATAGATPLFMLDYFASARLDESVFSDVISGLAEACRAIGCTLLGGETAEMPDVYAVGDYDLAGFMVGLVEPDVAPEVAAIRPGDALFALPSSGLHTNGYSLVRRVFGDVSLRHVYPELGVPLAEELLKPHRCYLRELSALRGAWKAAAHITGGGVLGNLPRCLPEGLGAVLDAGSWRVPPIFGLLARLGSIDDDDMYATFNMGLGMILVIDPDRIPADVPPDLVRVGDVVERRGAQRVVFR